MFNEATGGRRQRGLEIAATQVIRQNNGGSFMVPSQSDTNRHYRVVNGPDGLRCVCPDFELTGQTCKHGYAVDRRGFRLSEWLSSGITIANH
jgi:hypothetical protein